MDADSVYLVKTMGYPLTFCLAELMEVKPVDPIEWIAHWLYRYTDNEMHFYEKLLFLEDLAATKAELSKETKRHNRIMGSFTKEIDEMKTALGKKDDRQQCLSRKAIHRFHCQIDATPKPETIHELSKESARETRETLMEWVKAMGSISTNTDTLSSAGRAGIKRREQKSNKYLKKLLSDIHGVEIDLPDTVDKESQFGNTSTDTEDSFLLLADFNNKLEDINAVRDTLMQFGIPVPSFLDQGFLDEHQTEAKEALQSVGPGGLSSWSLDCKSRLVCDHSIIGKIKPRPVFVPPETPVWWAERGYLEQSLYDHEIYSTDLSAEDLPENRWWSGIRKMTYADLQPCELTKKKKRSVKPLNPKS